MAEQSSATIVSMTGIRKSFPGVQALKGVSLSVKAGEVHGLVGENGAGKSTLIKILMGAYSKDGGTITIEGREVEIHNPLQAKSQGMAAVYQDVMLARHLSAGENFFLGKLPRTPLGLVDWKKIHQVTRETLKDLDLSIDPRMLVRHLPPAQQEMVTIAKAVYEKSKVIVFDEPTALLTNEQVTGLFALIKKLKKKNVGVIYISHRLEEIFAICDRVTILKDGEWVETLEVSGTDQDTIITKMVGRSIGEMYSIHHPKRGENGLPRPFLNFAQINILWMPSLFFVWLVVIALSVVMTTVTRFGRNVFALGSNPEAARLSGINIRATLYGVYAFSALTSSIAGILYTSRLANGIPTAGEGYELDAIAAAVVGGASLMGGEGTILGTVLGALIIATLRNGGDLLGINPFILQIAIGVLIVAAVLIDQLTKRKNA